MPNVLETINKECHDCGQHGPHWCSINHGVFLCDECCSIHLSLGRHISQIKSFKQSYWPPTQLNLINELSLHGANLIWEYSLRDPQNRLPRKKPTARDALPIKAEFIRAKYQQLAYINRLKDENNGTYEDINLQLHSIVRTDNIVTCLRFLSQGADPNFRNSETGTSAIHVAASRGQQNQIELLCIYGGDPAIVDASGISPEEHARTNGYLDLADRLIELQYELTDRLICFIGGKRPDHKTNQHILVPDMSEIFDKTNQPLIARQKLQQLTDPLFEDLAMDVYDEIERRDLKTIWHLQVDKALIPLHVVPFLSVNPSFSATRNQGRQKLARYELKEFYTFIHDILNEFHRRYSHVIQQSSTTKIHAVSQPNYDLTTAFINSDEEPFYDKVASDEDPSSFEQQKRIQKSKKEDLTPTPTNINSMDNSNYEIIQNFSSDDLKTRITNTETQVKYLASAHIDLKHELSVLHQMIQRLLDENVLNKFDQQVFNNTSTFTNNNETNKMLYRLSQSLFDNISRKSSPFIESDYDNTTLIDDCEHSQPNIVQSTVNGFDKRFSRSLQRFPQIDEYISDITPSQNMISDQRVKQEIPVNIYRSRSCSERRQKPIPSPTLIRQGSYNQIDINTDITKLTQNITSRIAELFTLIKLNQTHQYATYAERINILVQDMIHLSQRLVFNEDIRANLDMLYTSTQQLLVHTKFEEQNLILPIHFIIDDCYGIALATRNLLSLYRTV
ncbi:unnamed protein product [Adineta steineri]|uniref:Arf-GAP domain-containing protein n=2 Tax=Adineta steineri TaxID=433720 RepID=A0A814ST59_9BILA|nr:unnamed protein product [Adineta steineri]CAF1149766.1 unnamed protein product [Adineta steineri]CAF1151534.1 unnamed protein product [Adineta steineri]